MIELAIFDMAGTTIDDRDEVYRVLREATEREGANYTDEVFQKWMGTEKKWAIENLLRLGGIEVDDELHEKTWEWFRQELRRTYTDNPPKPLPGIEEAMATLREQGIKVALTTGFAREIADLIFSSMGWKQGETFDASSCGDEVEAGRPAPDMIETVMKELGVEDTAAVVSVGDTSADVQSALRAEVTSVGVLTGHLSRKDFASEGAHLVLDSVAGLPDALADLPASDATSTAVNQ
ncbi:phosphonatase-like hydrolase [Brevibacterium zhoupengii]|uniref:phosphonatase-like hydrolase n=1 Tax=Brevibacterium zhoupengii TaxID=2898795 RepID=UPI001E483B7A|nr:phosphonatase-like hydrolase [Brevibacterium zhoupengii]